MGDLAISCPRSRHMGRPRGLLGLAAGIILGLCQARKCAVWTNEVVADLPVGAVATLDAAVELWRARRACVCGAGIRARTLPTLDRARTIMNHQTRKVQPGSIWLSYSVLL